MKKVPPNVTPAATSAITATFAPTSTHELQYFCDVQRLSELFFTGPRYLLSHNTTPAAWVTVHESLADGFIRKYADPLCLLGVNFGANTCYIMIDVDRYSANHPSINPRAFERLLKSLERVGLNTPVVIQSSSSGGIHIYYFLQRDINTYRLASLVLVTLINKGFEIKDGQTELFPNAKLFADRSNHKSHRLPLQRNGGGAILDLQGNPLLCGVNLNHKTQLAAFLQVAKMSATGNDIDKIEKQLNPVYKIFKKDITKYQHTYKKGLSDRAKLWKEDLEVRLVIAWTGFHQTNQLIPRFIAYAIVFLGLDDKQALFEWVYQAIITSNGYKQYCRHQSDIEARIWEWIHPTIDREFYVKYCGYPSRSNERAKFIAKNKTSKASPTKKAATYARLRVEQTVTRINKTIETILATAVTIPSRIEDLINLIQTTSRQLFRAAPSRNTLYKKHYKQLWLELLATEKANDMVLNTLITPPNMKEEAQVSTDSAFERSVFDTTDLPKTDVKPIACETSHSMFSLCSVIALPQPPLVNEADPNLDLAPKLENRHPYLDLDSQPTAQDDLISQLPYGRDTFTQPDLIETSTADLLNKSAVDRDNPINPSTHPINPDLDLDLDLDPTTYLIDPDSSHLQSHLPNFDTSYQSDSIKPSGADLITRSVHNHPQSIKQDPIELELIELDPIELDLIKLELIESDLIEPNPSDQDELIQLDQIHLQSAPTASLPNLYSNPQVDLIESSTTDLTSRSAHNHPQLIEPDPIEPDSIHLQSAPTASLPNLYSNPQVDLIEPSTADLTSRLVHDQDKLIHSDPTNPDYPSLKYFKTLSSKHKLQLTEQQMSEIRLSRFPLRTGSIIRPRDKYHVHGADRGVVTQIQPWGIFVCWSDGTSGRYASDELIHTYSPN